MFTLALPWVLILLPLPWLLRFLPPAKIVIPTALKVPFYSTLQNLADKKSLHHNKRDTSLFVILWALLVIALSGPRWIGEPIPLSREGRNIMMVLDLSGSMELQDMVMNNHFVSRLKVVKQAAEQFVRARRGDRIGLIVFGTQAYLQTPLTYDLQNVLLRIEDATAGLAGKTTSIGDALGLAVKRLQNVPPESRVVILLTDGANNSGVISPQRAAELAKLDGIKVYTIGLGAEVDPRVMNSAFFNMGAGIDLDEPSLKAIADSTNGRYFRATDANSLQSIYAMINDLEAKPEDEASVRPEHDYYAWPLGVALLILFYSLLKKSGLLERGVSAKRSELAI